MADDREVFTIVEDVTTGSGIKLPGRAEGDASGSNHMPAMVAKDSSGNYKLIELRDEGDAATGVDAQNILSVKDSAGNLQYINSRDEGDAISGVDALPGLVAKDSSGNFAYLELNADGELIVSSKSEGNKKSGSAVVVGVLDTATTILDVAITSSAVHEELHIMVSATRTTMWEIFNVDDVAGTPVETSLIEGIITGSGQFSFAELFPNLEFTAGSTGTQALRIKGTQLQGAATNLYATADFLEKT